MSTAAIDREGSVMSLKSWAFMCGAALSCLAFNCGVAAAASCTALAGAKLDNVDFLSSVEVPAAGDLPGYCRVLGFVRPAINFDVRLPLTGWNGKFYEVGCGGFCGTLDSDIKGFANAQNYALRRSYAVAVSDGGHWGAGSIDGRWALSNPVGKEDWAWRAETEVAKVGKALVAAYYGKAQDRAYFAGCSDGGRMAGVEVSRFPDDFDGIIMGAPALDFTGLVATFFSWIKNVNVGADGQAILPVSKFKLVEDAVYKQCADKGGLISRPLQCQFDPVSLQCKSGDGPECLSAAQVGVLNKWYGGPKNSAGQQLYPGGLPLGSEPFWANWLTPLAGLGDDSILGAFAENFVKYLAFVPDAGPLYSSAQYDYDKDPQRMGAGAKIYNATTFNPVSPGDLPATDLSAFAKHGGKLIIYHGWADMLVTPQLTTLYYESIAKHAGGLPQARDFARLFMIPGMDHCGVFSNGPGITDTGVDLLTALEGWVEKGAAPDQVLATKVDDKGQPLWQRPVCAWPQTATYKSGAPNLANSYACANP
ncbi:MAG: tannase/feruloyl esterase family alpha/beta hydrolase [Bradyrhizobium sp.]|nr:MAG: tannase/feruloyl esterase family alpha/beta hydrolase [Bradyrhizobium sp.]